MFWNIRWQDPERKNLMYVGTRHIPTKYFLRDPVWMQAHSGTTRHGAKFFSSDEKNALMEKWESLPDGFVWVCGSMRYKNAIQVSDGAVNIQAIANAIAEGAREVGDHCQPGTASEDPAIMLMSHQLAHLCRVAQVLDMSRYQAARDICISMCDSGGVKY